MSALFTCIACRVGFTSSEAQRAHYRTEWHRYNLQRKAVSLPCVSLAVFRSRQAQAQAQAAEQATEAAFTGECFACKKKYGSRAAYEQHLASKKHKAKVKAMEASGAVTGPLYEGGYNRDGDDDDDGAGGDGTGGKGDGIAAERLWEGARRVTLDDEPLIDEFLELYSERFADGLSDEDWGDLKSFILARGEIFAPSACLFCETLIDDPHERLEHMSRAHGFFIPNADSLIDLDGLLRYLSLKISLLCTCLVCEASGEGRTFMSPRAVQAHMVGKAHCTVPIRGDEAEYESFYDYSDVYLAAQMRARGMEPNPSLLSPEEREELLAAPPPESPYYDPETMELVLPSGRALGHRSLVRYYNQTLTERPQSDAMIATQRSASQRAIAWHGSLAAAEEANKAKTTVAGIKARESFKARVGESANNKKHFRLQILI